MNRVAAVFLLVLARAAWGQGSIADGPVVLTYPPTHWSATSPDTDLVGTEANPGADVLVHMGWFYRLEGGTREYPLPAPNWNEPAGYGRMITHWSSLGGSAWSATETVNVFDNERPSGGIGLDLTVVNHGATAQSIELFNYLDPSVGGTSAGDEVVALAPGYLKFSQGADVVRYQCTNGNPRYSVTDSGYLLNRLNDDQLTELYDHGAPHGPANLRAVFQATSPVLQPGGSWTMHVRISSRLYSDHAKGAGLSSNPSTYPPLLVRFNDGASGAIGRRRHEPFVYRTRWGSHPGFELAATDDFDGDFVDEGVNRNPTTGETKIGGVTVQGAPSPSWRIAATGDFDGDGNADLVWQNSVSGSLRVWRMDGAVRLQTLVPSPSQAADANWELAGVGDFNLDGNLDFLFFNRTSHNLVLWFMDENLQRILGTFTDPPNVSGPGWRVVAVGDYGKGTNAGLNTPDIVWQNDASRRIVIWHMTAEERTSGVFTDAADPYDGASLEVIGPR